MYTTPFEELCSKLKIDWSDVSNNDLFTESQLTNWLTIARDLAVARWPWPFTEGRREFTTASGTEKYEYQTDMKTDGIRYLTVNGKRYQKVLFDDYMNYREDYDTGSEKIYTDYNRTIYINYLASGFANSIVAYAQVGITGAVSSAVSTTVFTMAEPEGDDAIVKLAYSMALGSDKKKRPNEAVKERSEAIQILDSIWKRISDDQFSYQTHDRPMWGSFDVLNGGNNSINRNQFNL